MQAISDDLYQQFIKNSYILYNFCCKVSGIVVFAFTCVGKPFIFVQRKQV
jgi:hypothetical protein